MLTASKSKHAGAMPDHVGVYDRPPAKSSWIRWLVLLLFMAVAFTMARYLF